MSLKPRPQLQFADWLAAERAADQGRTQYLGGEVFAMAGGTGACDRGDKFAYHRTIPSVRGYLETRI